ncbi:MAG: hypothetical protein EPO08_07845 [Rhodospirillaceae bacterium]|nr:MAG: hypothetical protein EPO08_07845 [Rhodospirillaceae bacterium]
MYKILIAAAAIFLGMGVSYATDIVKLPNGQQLLKVPPNETAADIEHAVTAGDSTASKDTVSAPANSVAVPAPPAETGAEASSENKQPVASEKDSAQQPNLSGVTDKTPPARTGYSLDPH